MKAPRPFLAEYKRGLALYGSHIWARDWRQARAYAQRRGIGEVVVGAWERTGELPASEVIRTRGAVRIKVHALCWLGMLATSCGAATAADFFDDQSGILHQFVHAVNQNGDPAGENADVFPQVLLAVQRLQRKVPGYLPPISHSDWGKAARRRGYV